MGRVAWERSDPGRVGKQGARRNAWEWSTTPHPSRFSSLAGHLPSALFAALATWLARRWRRTHEVVVVREVAVPAALGPAEPFVVDDGKLRDLGITPREHEILGLIAEGLSNREIGARVFISENTVKTHSSRLFDKLGVSRRVQAVQRARELGLIR